MPLLSNGTRLTRNVHPAWGERTKSSIFKFSVNISSQLLQIDLYPTWKYSPRNGPFTLKRVAQNLTRFSVKVSNWVSCFNSTIFMSEIHVNPHKPNFLSFRYTTEGRTGDMALPRKQPRKTRTKAELLTKPLLQQMGPKPENSLTAIRPDLSQPSTLSPTFWTDPLLWIMAEETL